MLATSQFRGRHVISVGQFSKEHLHILFTVAQEMRLAVQRQGVIADSGVKGIVHLVLRAKH